MTRLPTSTSCRPAAGRDPAASPVPGAIAVARRRCLPRHRRSPSARSSPPPAEQLARFAAAGRYLAACLSRQLGFLDLSIFKALAKKTAAEKPLRPRLLPKPHPRRGRLPLRRWLDCLRQPCQDRVNPNCS